MSTVMTQQVQQGTVVSSALPFSAGMTSASASALMSAADAANPANTLTMYIAASYDENGLAFTRQFSFGWQGGPNSGNTPPGISWGPDPQNLPTFTRVEYDLPQAISIGADLTNS